MTWTDPRSKYGHIIGFIITRKRNIGDVCYVRVIRRAECETDHSWVRGWFKFRVCRKHRIPGVKVPKRLDVKLKQKNI